MGVYVYCLKENYTHKSQIKGREYENEWFRLDEDGTILIKGTHYKGYAWDGCSPKIKIKDLYFGTPEAVLNFATGKSKTYYASLIHDVFYQFSEDVKPFIDRREVDYEFYLILRENNFSFARLYYIFVRRFGWLFW